MTRNLVAGFVGSATRFPDRPALEVDGRVWSYRALSAAARAVADAVADHASPEAPYVHILSRRGAQLYAAVLGALGAGRAYVALNPAFPTERLRRMIRIAPAAVLVIGPEEASLLPELLAEAEAPVVILAPPGAIGAELRAALSPHEVAPLEWEADPGRALDCPVTDPDAVACVLFTSGTTGAPKGVPARHRSLVAYTAYAAYRYSATEDDRFSQIFDMTFDFSISEVFVCWEAGGCVCAMAESEQAAPAHFIRRHAITVWQAAPSSVALLERLRLLRPGVFPTLRVTLFGGAVLTGQAAAAWQAAAPNAAIDNIYGPTEAAVCISTYRWDPEASPGRCHNGAVPLGWILAGQSGIVVDNDLNPVAPGVAGELLISGSHVCSGYLGDPERTAASFVEIAARPGVTWYRTGDTVLRDPDGCLLYLGRRDEQVKIRGGYRVELQEVDHALRVAAGTDMALSVAWPPDAPERDAIYGFVAAEGEWDPDDVLEACRAQLPSFMAPRAVFPLEALPLSRNGKPDRRALEQLAIGVLSQ